MNKCKNCGSEFDSKFCPECGTPIEQSEEKKDKAVVETEEKHNNKANTTNDKGVLIAAITILVISVIAWFLPVIKVDDNVYLCITEPYSFYSAIIFSGVIALNIVFYIVRHFFFNKKTESVWEGFDIARYVVNGLVIIYSITNIAMQYDMFDNDYMYKNCEWSTAASSWVLFIALLLNLFLSCIYRLHFDVKILSLKQKFKEVAIQFALLPVSALISAMTFFVILIWVSYILVVYVWAKKIKKKLFDGYSWNDGGVGEYTYTATVSHDVRDAHGNKIGSFDTAERRTGYDDGYRHWGLYLDSSLKLIWALACFALPLRIVSFIMSIFACFISNLYVVVKCPNVDYLYAKNRYKEKVFFLLDTIVS